jgi:hypothetical protein
MKSWNWYIKFPCDAYAMGPIGFGKPVSERKVREYARKWANVNRLPNGFECWRA